MNRLITVTALLLLSAATASADVGFQFTAPGVQSPESDSVKGMRLSLLHGKTDNVDGFDMGMFSYSESNTFRGAGPFFAIGHVTGRSAGCFCSFANIHEGEATGVTAGFLNSINNATNGVTIGFLNLTEGTSNIEISGLGISEKSKMQFGFVNVTQEIGTLQIGFLNVAENGMFPVFPFFNMPKK